MTTSLVLFIIIWLVCSSLVGLYAEKKGLNVIGYTVGATLLSPLLAWLFALSAEPGNVKTCPKCAEQVKQEAKICKHCRSELS